MERQISPAPKTKTSAAFTLVELLVVISIIVILAALSFPAVNGALDSAKKTQAKSNAVQIAGAVSAYELEYGKLPLLTSSSSSSDSTGDVGTFLTEILGGASGNANNSRTITFLEMSSYKKGKGGTNSSGDYLDPWGSAYKIVLDHSYDNSITAGTNGQTLRKKVGVWNDPSKHSPAPSTTAETRRYVTSWE
jgi:prepilin-type N-terminal cleavage/methylation domain-containing protein